MKKKIKIIAMSDIHGYLPDMSKYKMDKPFDLLLIAGDILPLEIQRMDTVSRAWILEDFYGWCNKLIESRFVYDIVYIPGNHDFILDQEYIRHIVYSTPRPSYKYRSPHIHLLIDEMFTYKGWKVYGSPWCPNLKNWAFYGSPEKLTMKFETIPDNTDILITHCPPQYQDYGKILAPGHRSYDVDCGSWELYQAVAKRPNIKLHVFGHIHSGNHRPDANINKTIFANVSIKGEDYTPIYEPLIIELQKEN